MFQYAKQQRSPTETRESRETLRQQQRLPKQCQQCHRQSRRGCKLCRVCRSKQVNTDLVINQGCPTFHQRSLPHPIRWWASYPDLAFWLGYRPEYVVDRPSTSTKSQRIKVVGWKGGSDLNAEYVVNGPH